MPKQKLTVKEARLVSAKAAGKKHHEAYEEAGYAPTNRKSEVANTSKVLSRPHVQEALEKALKKHEITMDAAVKPIADGLQAVKYFEANEDGTATGQPDHSIRLKASSMALKLMGAEKQEGGGITFNFKGNATFAVDKYKDAE